MIKAVALVLLGVAPLACPATTWAEPSVEIGGSFICVHEDRLGAAIQTIRDLSRAVDSARLLKIEGDTAYFGEDDVLDRAEFRVRSNHNAFVVMDQVVMFDGAIVTSTVSGPPYDDALDAISNTMTFNAGGGVLTYQRLSSGSRDEPTIYRFSCMVQQ